MADDRERNRLIFDCPEEIKRAIRSRAGIDGVSPADVIIAASQVYLSEEIEMARKRIQENGEGPKKTRKKRDQSERQQEVV